MGAITQAAKALGIRLSHRARGSKLIWYGNERKRDINRIARKRVTEAVNLIRRTVVYNITKKQVVYRNGVAQRSSRGEYPRMDTGRLSSGIRSFVVQKRGGGWTGKVTTNVPYAKILESEALDRYFLSRTVREIRPKIQKIMQRKWFSSTN